MIFNCEPCQSEFSVLSGWIITKLSKICFLCTNLVKMNIQQRLMFCSKFSLIIFLLMFFPLFLKVFTNILKSYELPKINNMIPEYCQTLVLALTIIIYQANSMSQLYLASKRYPFIENMPLGSKVSFDTKLTKILGRTVFKKLVPKESFFFVASDVVPILYNRPCICTGD